ncbi:hypothetical protein A359_04640 [secondary endosymbiont of Ctenarytaina eucalypti]|uniref:Uncharacterized protein n=1 Tax=secondary endosymbiont of Ctenarytaina eucalypti TaxID=1199245 RepID=J3TFB0_9ENTR|nr:hypothetical protein A359_04640 [secondary endosymbiont of Ctenarytaina eucalypti]
MHFLTFRYNFGTHNGSTVTREKCFYFMRLRYGMLTSFSTATLYASSQALFIFLDACSDSL